MSTVGLVGFSDPKPRWVRQMPQSGMGYALDALDNFFESARLADTEGKEVTLGYVILGCGLRKERVNKMKLVVNGKIRR